MTATNTGGDAPFDPVDGWHMRTALGLAARGLGRVWPNPAVGCVLVGGEDGRIVGRGWTAPGGRPHAETQALARAGGDARGATAYVTLEPCAHHGETPPCADALVAAGIARAVIAIKDPDPRVSGRGIAALEAAGIKVVTGVCGPEAEQLNAGYLLCQTAGRPLVLLKTATGLDGRIATRTGQSRWITGAAARARGHLLRAQFDAILVGAGTVAADDPDLTCRLPGLDDRSPVRVVLDSALRTSPDAKVIATARETPTWVIAARAAERSRATALIEAGAEVIEVTADAHGRPTVDAVLQALAERGITRLLVEGGSGVAAAFVRAGRVDRLAWFRAARLLGGDGLAAIGPLALEAPGDGPAFRRTRVIDLGQDVLETYALVA